MYMLLKLIGPTSKLSGNNTFLLQIITRPNKMQILRKKPNLCIRNYHFLIPTLSTSFSFPNELINFKPKLDPVNLREQGLSWKYSEASALILLH